MLGLIQVRTPEAKEQSLVLIPFMTILVVWWALTLVGKEIVTITQDQVTFVSSLGPLTYTRRLVRDGTFTAGVVSQHMKRGHYLHYLVLRSGGRTLRTHKYLEAGEADVAVEVANEWIQQT